MRLVLEQLCKHGKVWPHGFGADRLPTCDGGSTHSIIFDPDRLPDHAIEAAAQVIASLAVPTTLNDVAREAIDAFLNALGES